MPPSALRTLLPKPPCPATAQGEPGACRLILGSPLVTAALCQMEHKGRAAIYNISSQSTWGWQERGGPVGSASRRWPTRTFWSLCRPRPSPWRGGQGPAPSGSPGCGWNGNSKVPFEGQARRWLQAGGKCPKNPPDIETGWPRCSCYAALLRGAHRGPVALCAIAWELSRDAAPQAPPRPGISESAFAPDAHELV